MQRGPRRESFRGKRFQSSERLPVNRIKRWAKTKEGELEKESFQKEDLKFRWLKIASKKNHSQLS